MNCRPYGQTNGLLRFGAATGVHTPSGARFSDTGAFAGSALFFGRFFGVCFGFATRVFGVAAYACDADGVGRWSRRTGYFFALGGFALGGLLRSHSLILKVKIDW